MPSCHRPLPAVSIDPWVDAGVLRDPRMWGCRRAAIATLGLALSLGACVPDRAADRSLTRDVGAVPPIEAMQREQRSSQSLIGTAHERVIGDCMARAGFDYAALAASRPSDSWPTEVTRSYPFGFESQADVPDLSAPVDHGSSGDGPLPQGGDPTAWSLALLGTEEDRITYKTGSGVEVGRPGSGCIAEADRALYGDEGVDDAEFRALLIFVKSQAIADAQQDDEVRNATDAWRSCAERSGASDFRTPVELASRVNRARGDGTTQAEVDRLAEIDLACKTETDLLAIGHLAIYDAQVTLLKDHPGLIDDYKAFVDRQLQRANEILAR